jgi:uncharacterized DUF497 family protein
MKKAHFAWDDEKDHENQAKHGVPFSLAQRAFLDPHRIIAEDVELLYWPSRRRNYDRAIHVPRK